MVSRGQGEPLAVRPLARAGGEMGGRTEGWSSV